MTNEIKKSLVARAQILSFGRGLGVLAATVLFTLSGCDAPKDLQNQNFEFSYPSSRNRQSDKEQRRPGQLSEVERKSNRKAPELVLRTTNRAEVVDEASPPRVKPQSVSLQFVDAPVADAVRTIVNLLFEDNVAIGPGISGKITLTSDGEVPAQKALDILEALLADMGLVLQQLDSGFLLTTVERAGQRTQPLMSSSDSGGGFGARFIDLNYISARDAVRVVEPLKSKNVTLMGVDAQNILIVKGPVQDIDVIDDVLKRLDQPRLEGRSVGLFALQYAQAGDIKQELEVITKASLGSSSGLVETLAIDRLNFVLISAANDRLYDQAVEWLKQLDRESLGTGTTLHYYSVKHKSAEELASIVAAAYSLTDGTGRGRSVVGDIMVVPDTVNNGIIVRATLQDYQSVLRLLEQMDAVSPQILIEATIVEISLTDDFRFGVNWNYSENGETVTLSNLANGAVAAQFPGLSFTSIGANVQVALSALSSVTNVNVISAPKLMVVDNKTAMLQVGDEVPIVTRQAQSVTDPNAPIVTNVELRETGVILEVKPRVSANDYIELTVSQEVSDVAETTTSGIDSPTIQQRKFSSVVSVKDGETVALGGLIRTAKTRSDSGVPLLQSIPAVGNLFKTQEDTARKTELIIFLTPHLVEDADDAREALNYLRQQLDFLEVSPSDKGVGVEEGSDSLKDVND